MLLLGYKNFDVKAFHLFDVSRTGLDNNRDQKRETIVSKNLINCQSLSSPKEINDP